MRTHLSAEVGSEQARSYLKTPSGIALIHFFSKVQRKYRHRSREHLGWIVVTHICQRWRGVALDNPTFWICIPFHRPSWVPEMAKRSKSVTRKIELNSRSFFILGFPTYGNFWLSIYLAFKVSNSTSQCKGTYPFKSSSRTYQRIQLDASSV